MQKLILSQSKWLDCHNINVKDLYTTSRHRFFFIRFNLALEIICIILISKLKLGRKGISWHSSIIYHGLVKIYILIKGGGYLGLSLIIQIMIPLS